jgi:hypothetical protein
MRTQAVAAIVGICAFIAPAYAEDSAAYKTPPKIMGDEGKHPPSKIVRERVPDMTSPDGTAKENIRPATQAMDQAVPDMKGSEIKTE